MKRVVIDKCPYCGSNALVYGYQYDSANVFTDIRGSVFGSQIEHLICRECGSVVYSRVVKPEMFKNFVSEQAKHEFEKQAEKSKKKVKKGILEIIVDDE